MRKSKRLIAILATVALIVTMLVPMSAVPALASGSISALSVPSVVDDPANPQAVGTIKVTIPAGSVIEDDSVVFKLPDGFDFDTAFYAAPDPDPVDPVQNRAVNARESHDNVVVVPNTVSGDANGLLAEDVQVTILDAKDEIEVRALADAGTDFDFVFYVYLGAIEVEEGTDTDCVVNFDGPGGSGFPTGDVTVAKCSGAGKVILAPTGQDTSNSDFSIDLRIKEETAGSLEFGKDSLDLELPNGYVWTCPELSNFKIEAPLKRWGNDIWVNIRYNNNKDTIYVDFLGADTDDDGNNEGTDTDEASCWDLTEFLTFTVDDEEDCEVGTIIAQVGGESDTNVTEGPVGTFGEFGTKVSAEDVQDDLIAGQAEQEIGDLVIEESLEETLIDGRTITVTLPDGVAWWPVYDAATDDIDDNDPDNLSGFDSDEGVGADFSAYSGTDDRTAKFVVDGSSNDAAKIKLKNCKVSIEAGFEGDLKVTVGGTAGVTGEAVLGTVKAPCTATADATPSVIIGASGQAAGTATIKENIKEGFIEGGTVDLTLPTDVEFDGTPDVKVTEGNLKITNIMRSSDNRHVYFDIDSNSSTPSTVVVSNIKLKIYRTVPEGAIALKVKGDGAVETCAYDKWANSDVAAKTTIAVCATPAPSDEKATVVFKINDTNYTVNGVAQTMDIAPYIKDGRTFLPVRYVALACGVSADNILFSNGKVTLIKGDKVVQVTIGSKTMLINGAAIDMDVAAEISNGRTMLPFSFIARALGASVTFDSTAQTVTMTI